MAILESYRRHILKNFIILGEEFSSSVLGRKEDELCFIREKEFKHSFTN